MAAGDLLEFEAGLVGEPCADGHIVILVIDFLRQTAQQAEYLFLPQVLPSFVDIV